ncbi:MAG: F0F1 ATP synthase subunit B family protein [Alphaproteobacteria bacterium]
MSHAFYEDPAFIVLIGFVITFALVGKAIYKKITEALDARSDSIRSEIEEATKLREDAQDLLASFERKQREALAEAGEIAERAAAEAEFLRRKSTEELDQLMVRRERQAADRIAHAETAARDEIRSVAIDVATDAVRHLLSQKLSGKKGNALIDDAIGEIAEKLN